jgi:hypothetical protein
MTALLIRKDPTPEVLRKLAKAESNSRARAFDPPHHRRWRLGFLLHLVSRRNGYRGIGCGRRPSLGHRGQFRDRKKRTWSRPQRDPLLARMAPPRLARHAGLRHDGRDPPSRQLRAGPANDTRDPCNPPPLIRWSIQEIRRIAPAAAKPVANNLTVPVKRLGSLGAGPKPGGAAAYLNAGAQGLEEFRIAFDKREHGLRRAQAIGLVSTADRDPLLLDFFDDAIEEIADDLVAIGGDADSFALANQFTYHVRAGVGLNHPDSLTELR